mgnify:FL=1
MDSIAYSYYAVRLDKINELQLLHIRLIVIKLLK